MHLSRLLAMTAICGTVLTAPVAAGAHAAPAPTASSANHAARASAKLARALERSRPRPAAVRSLAAYEDGRRVTLSWRDPAAGAFQRVVVRYRAGHHAPTGPRRGMPAVVDGSHATTAVLRHLDADTSYAAAVWTVAAGRVSNRVDVSFRTAGPPPGPPAADSVVSGFVTDAAGAPLAGVVVAGSPRFYNSSGPDVRRSVTDARGHYSLTVSHGMRYLTFDGSRATGGSSDTTGYLGDATTVRLAPHQHATIDRTLATAAALRGRVVDAKGNGVAGARITPSFPFPFVNVDTSYVSWSFFMEVGAAAPRTGPRGYFRMTGLPDDSLTVCARVPRVTRSACSDQPVLASPGTTGNAGVIQLPAASPAGTVVGHVRDTDGFPVRGAEILLEGHRFFSLPHFGHTAADGSFRVSGLRGGVYDVCVSPVDVPRPRHHSGLLSSCLRHSVHVRAGHTTRRNAVVRPGAAVTGVVRGPDGRPVPNVEISLDGHNDGTGTVTDARGRFIAVGVPTGRYRLCAFPQGRGGAGGGTGDALACLDGKVSLEAGHTLLGAEINLPAGGAIVGHVDPSKTGRPDIFAFAHRIGAGHGEWPAAAQVRRGEYRLTGLLPGRYRVCFDVSWSDLSTSTQCLTDTVPVRRSRTTVAADFALRPNGAIAVVVRDTAARPIVGVDATAVMECHRRYECDHLPFFDAAHPQLVAGSWMSSRDGSVLLDGLHPGHYAVCAFGYLGAVAGTTPPTGFADSCSGATFDITVAADQLVHRSLTLATAGAVSGTVTDEHGDPLQGVRVHITGSAAVDTPRGGSGTPAHRAAVTGADGTYVVRSIAPGDQTVCVDPSGAKPRGGYRWQCVGAPPGAHRGGTPVTVTSGQVTVGVDLVVHR